MDRTYSSVSFSRYSGWETVFIQIIKTTIYYSTVSARKPRKTKKTAASKPRVRRKVYGEKHISFFLILVCLLQTVFLGGLLFVLISLQIPNISTVANYQPRQATVIYDRHKNIVDRIFVENRTVIPLGAMSPYLPNAFVAAEDGRFYEHPGLDFFSVLRAAINNIRHGAKGQGGSTITQQVAKSLLLTPEKTYVRKFKEAILAWRIDQLLGKKEILYIYLNQIYLGEGAHGVEAAAQIYFGKSAARLTLGECALLAGLPQAPSRYSLFNHLDRAVKRQKYVLNRMAADGFVSAAAAKKAYKAKIHLKRGIKRSANANGFYLAEVRKRSRAILGVPLQTAGAKIYTNLDAAMQKKAAVAVSKGVKASAARQTLKKKGAGVVPQGALVCIETAHAKIRAVTGGTSFKKSPFNRATQAKRPAGSTFKPFVFAAALYKGWTSQSSILDSPLSIKGKDGSFWEPKNYGGKYYGTTTLSKALIHSLNSASVRLMQGIGYKDVHKIARMAGLTSDFPPDLSLALGATDVSLLEMTAAYTIFAGNGTFTKPSFIDKIVLTDGSVIRPALENKTKKVLSASVLRQMRSMLKGVVKQGTGRAVKNVTGVQGGKTGTSDDNRDAWFIGYDKKYTVGVWVGNDLNQPLGRSESGGKTAAPIWRDFL